MDQRVLDAQKEEQRQQPEKENGYAGFLAKTDERIREKAAKAQEMRENDYQRKRGIVLKSENTSELRTAAEFLEKLNYKDSGELAKQGRERNTSIYKEQEVLQQSGRRKGDCSSVRLLRHLWLPAPFLWF